MNETEPYDFLNLITTVKHFYSKKYSTLSSSIIKTLTIQRVGKRFLKEIVQLQEKILENIWFY